MQDAIIGYFTGERHAAIMIGTIGALALVVAAIFLQPRWELRSFAVALGVVGLLELAVGIGLYVRTGPQAAGLLAQLEFDAARVHAEEAARMAGVQRNFIVLQLVWLGLVLAAGVVGVAFKGRPALWGAALGLCVQAAIFLVFDLVAERRGAAYLTALTARR